MQSITFFIQKKFFLNKNNDIFVCMVATPKKRLNKEQKEKLDNLLFGDGRQRTERSIKFAKRCGLGVTSIHRARKGESLSTFIIDKIIEKL